jgi:hypothetical protein
MGAAGRRDAWCRGGFVVACMLLGRPGGHAQTAAASPSPSPPPQNSPGLKLDVERHVERVLEEHAKPTSRKEGLPRFETRVEVEGKVPQIMFERYLRDFDMKLGPTFSSAPTVAESMEQLEGTPKSRDTNPIANILPLIQWLGRKTRSDDPPKYFLYRVMTPEGIFMLLREERLAPSSVAPGTLYELVGTYPDMKTAMAEYKRLDREAAEKKARAETSHR